MEAHYNLTWPHIIEKVWKIDFFVAWLWTTGTLLWTAKYLKEIYPDIKIIAINPLDKVEWIKDYNKVKNIWQFYKDYKYLIDEVINVTFKEDAIPWVNDYIEEWYFNGISSWAMLSWMKKFLVGKSGLKGVVISPDWWDYYFSELFHKIDSSRVKECK
jgi:cysteine synthase